MRFFSVPCVSVSSCLINPETIGFLLLLAVFMFVSGCSEKGPCLQGYSSLRRREGQTRRDRDSANPLPEVGEALPSRSVCRYRGAVLPPERTCLTRRTKARNMTISNPWMWPSSAEGRAASLWLSKLRGAADSTWYGLRARAAIRRHVESKVTNSVGSRSRTTTTPSSALLGSFRNS